jgi:hypothetical protein
MCTPPPRFSDMPSPHILDRTVLLFVFVLALATLAACAGCQTADNALTDSERSSLDRAVAKAEKPPRRPLTGPELEGLEDLVRSGVVK